MLRLLRDNYMVMLMVQQLKYSRLNCMRNEQFLLYGENNFE